MKLKLICGYCESDEFIIEYDKTVCACCGETMESIYDYDINELESIEE